MWWTARDAARVRYRRRASGPVMTHTDVPALRRRTSYSTGYPIDRCPRPRRTNCIGHGDLFWAHSAPMFRQTAGIGRAHQEGRLTDRWLSDSEPVRGHVANSGNNALSRDPEFARIHHAPPEQIDSAAIAVARIHGAVSRRATIRRQAGWPASASPARLWAFKAARTPEIFRAII